MLQRLRSGALTLSLLLVALALAPTAGAAGTDANGLDLNAYKGKVVYLDFWASWCAPCKQSFPFMQSLAATYPSRDLAIIAVNLDHSQKRAEAFLNEVGANFPVVYDPKGALAKRFKVSDMPTSILIGRDGTVRYVHQGFFPAKEGDYQSQVSQLIHELK